VTTRITLDAAAAGISMRAWGPGTAWALENFPDLVGGSDEELAAAFVPLDAVVGDLHRRMPGLRMARSQAVVEALVPTVLEQKVVGLEAKRSYAAMVRALGEPAPRPTGAEGVPMLMLPPGPETLAATPYFVFHRFGVERRRADTIRRVGLCAPRLEEATRFSTPDALRRLTAIPGIGPWSAAEVGRVALGDADAVSVGDYHLPHQVAWVLAGEARADDERMLELLEPYRGQRGRVTRLIMAGGLGPPRVYPRAALRSIASI